MSKGRENIIDFATVARVTYVELRNAGEQGGTRQLFERMMEARCIDPQIMRRADPLGMRDVERICERCPNKARCRLELAAGTADINADEFCPNATRMFALGLTHFACFP